METYTGTVPLGMGAGGGSGAAGLDWAGRLGGWATGQRGREGWMEERWGPSPQATPFRCIPAPGPVTSAHSPPLEPRASFQVPSAASSPARVSDPLHALSPRSLSLSRILCRQVRETLIPHFGAPQGPSSPFGVVSKAAAPEDVSCVYPWRFPSPLGESSARWLSITRPAVVAEPLMGLRVPFFGRSLRPPRWLMCLYHPAWSIASACPSPQFPLPGTRSSCNMEALGNFLFLGYTLGFGYVGLKSEEVAWAL